MEDDPFNNARKHIIEREFQLAIDLLKPYVSGDMEDTLLELETRLRGFYIDESSGRFSFPVMNNMQNDIIHSIVRFIKILETEESRRKELQEISQAKLPFQNEGGLPPKEILQLRSKIILKMRNMTGPTQRKAYQLKDWVNLKLDCQIVKEQLGQCDWRNYDDRLEAYTLIKPMSDIFTEFLFGMKSTENERLEVYDLIDCASPLLTQMLDDIHAANSGNDRKENQLEAKQESLEIRLEKILAELNRLIEIAEIN